MTAQVDFFVYLLNRSFARKLLVAWKLFSYARGFRIPVHCRNRGDRGVGARHAVPLHLCALCVLCGERFLAFLGESSTCK